MKSGPIVWRSATGLSFPWARSAQVVAATRDQICLLAGRTCGGTRMEHAAFHSTTKLLGCPFSCCSSTRWADFRTKEATPCHIRREPYHAVLLVSWAPWAVSGTGNICKSLRLVAGKRHHTSLLHPNQPSEGWWSPQSRSSPREINGAKKTSSRVVASWESCETTGVILCHARRLFGMDRSQLISDILTSQPNASAGPLSIP
jgi:hypothetical protein